MTNMMMIDEQACKACGCESYSFVKEYLFQQDSVHTFFPDSPPDEVVCDPVLAFGLMGVITLLINLANNNFTECS